MVKGYNGRETIKRIEIADYNTINNKQFNNLITTLLECGYMLRITQECNYAIIEFDWQDETWSDRSLEWIDCDGNIVRKQYATEKEEKVNG